MSSFGANARFRVGYWIAVRSFLLRERRDVASTLEVIEAELSRIGRVRVQYERTVDPKTQKITVTENRLNLSVSADSTLEKLLRAYIAMGGNPYDISHFLMPDETEIIDTPDGTEEVNYNYPYGGVVAPLTSNYNEPTDTYYNYPGGFVPLKKYIPGRYSYRPDFDESTDMTANLMQTLRRPSTQAIREKIQELEHRILKLCDLREQLVQERDDIINAAHGGTLYAIPDFDTDRYTETLRSQQIVHQLDNIIFEKGPDGRIDGQYTDPERLAQYDPFYEDAAEELYLSLMA